MMLLTNDTRYRLLSGGYCHLVQQDPFLANRQTGFSIFLNHYKKTKKNYRGNEGNVPSAELINASIPKLDYKTYLELKTDQTEYLGCKGIKG